MNGYKLRHSDPQQSKVRRSQYKTRYSSVRHSLNDSHAVGRSEHSRLILTGLLITLYVPIGAAVMILVGATMPAWTVFDGALDLDTLRLRAYLQVFTIDAGGFAGYIAFGGLLLAVNRIETTSQKELDADSAVKMFMVLRFRNWIQWASVVGAATAPSGGLLWIILNADRPDWLKSSAAILIATLALSTVLLLAVPGSGYFSLQSVAREWDLNHTAFRRDNIARTWGNRWGTRIDVTDPGRWHLARMAWRWLLISLLAAGEAVLLVQVFDEVKPDWSRPDLIRIVLLLFVFNAYFGGFVLVATGLIAESAVAASNRGWVKTSRLARLCALLIGPSAAAIAFNFDYAPFTVMAWSVASAQVAYALGILNQGVLRSPVWWPVRGMVLNARSQSHAWANRRWRVLDDSLAKGLAELPGRERKRKEKEISRWRQMFLDMER